MEVEILALESRKTRDISDLKKINNNVGCRLLYLVKYKPNDDRDHYKARLLAKKYTIFMHVL